MIVISKSKLDVCNPRHADLTLPRTGRWMTPANDDSFMFQEVENPNTKKFQIDAIVENRNHGDYF